MLARCRSSDVMSSHIISPIPVAQSYTHFDLPFLEKKEDIICVDLHLASVAGMDDITCDDLTFDHLNPECVRLWCWV